MFEDLMLHEELVTLVFQLPACTRVGSWHGIRWFMTWYPLVHGMVSVGSWLDIRWSMS